MTNTQWHKFIFIYCEVCGDVKKLQRRKVYCGCRLSYGWLHKRYNRFAVYGGRAIPLTTPSDKLKRNIIDEKEAPKIRCPKCKKMVYSLHRHDFQWCPCNSVAIDGGFDYCKLSASQEILDQLTKDKPCGD